MKRIGQSASGQMLGYLYQIDRAILSLSSITNQDGIVEVETDDDVVTRLKKGNTWETIYEQDKSTVTKNNPYSDTSINFWKSIAIWVNHILDKSASIDSSYFYLVSSKKISNSCLAAKINKANNVSEAQKCLMELKSTALKLSKQAKQFSDIVLKASDEQLIRLIIRINTCSGDYENDRSQIKNQIRGNLRLLTNDDIPFEDILWHLEGWTKDNLIKKWLNDEPGILKVEDFNSVFLSKTSLIKNLPFIEQVAHLIPVSNDDRDIEKGSMFVKQLEHIEAPDNLKLNAIDDFIRAKMQHIRYAQSGKLTNDDIRSFQDNLKKHWELISGLTEEENDIRTGKRIYKECLGIKTKLAGVEPSQPYTINGEYHLLSNKLELGWHPKWESLLKHKNE